MEELKNNDKKANSSNPLGNIKASFSSRKFKSGAFVSMLTVIVIVIIVVVNLIITEFDVNIDMSEQDLYTLTDNTVNLIENLEDDVTIYYLTESGKENTLFQKIAQEYDKKSRHIALEYKDPTLYPRFVYDYIDDEIEVNLNSFLVVNNNTKRAEYIDKSELLIQKLDTGSFQYYTTGIDAEGQLTAAIQYVTDTNLPVMYYTTGHNELETGEYLIDMLDKQNVRVDSLETLTADAVPEDCDILLIYAPAFDFTEDEINIIKDYMVAGGNVIAIIDHFTQGLTNLGSLLDYYGIYINEGIVYEGDTGRVANNNYPQTIVPMVEEHDITNRIISNKALVYTPEASGLGIKDSIRSSLEIKPLLKTSNKAYSKVKTNPKTFDKEKGDIDGPFYIGLLSTETYKGVTSNMIVYSSLYSFYDEALKMYNGNAELLSGSVGFLADKVASVSVKERSLMPNPVILTQKQANYIGLAVIVVLPALILSTGIVIILRRRKR